MMMIQFDHWPLINCYSFEFVLFKLHYLNLCSVTSALARPQPKRSFWTWSSTMLLPMKWIGLLLDGGSPTTKPPDTLLNLNTRRYCRFADDPAPNRRLLIHNNPIIKRQSPHTSDEDRGGGTGNHLQPRTTSGNHQQRGGRNRTGKERHCSIEDDEHGHLIYKTGDILQDRCTYYSCISISILSNS